MMGGYMSSIYKKGCKQNNLHFFSVRSFDKIKVRNILKYSINKKDLYMVNKNQSQLFFLPSRFYILKFVKIANSIVFFFFQRKKFDPFLNNSNLARNDVLNKIYEPIGDLDRNFTVKLSFESILQSLSLKKP